MAVRPIIFGATGMVGEGVLHIALDHPDVESVLVIGRKPCGRSHPRLREILHADLFDFSPIGQELEGYNACFFCLGVSSIGMSEEAYTRVTHDLTLHCARVLSELNPGMTFCYVSGTGTDSTEKGRSMWARVKGMTENRLSTLPFAASYNFRPGFIRPIPGLRNTHGFATAIGAAYPVLRMLLPGFVCTMDDLGRAMIRVCTSGYPKRTLENRDIAAAGTASQE